MAVSAFNTVQQFTLSFVSSNGTGIPLSILNVMSNIFSRYEKGENIKMMMSECNKACNLGKGLSSLSGITAKVLNGSDDSSWNGWDALKDVGNIISGVKSAIVTKPQDVGIHSSESRANKIGAISGMIAIACQINKDGIKSLQTWIVIYLKVDDICKGVFAWAGVDLKDTKDTKDTDGSEDTLIKSFKKNVYDIAYHKDIKFIMGIVTIGNSLLSHQDNKLWNALGLQQYFGQTATAA
ncbi:MAG: hypothetical protein H7A40_05275 [Chlamydiales bacterium]|nr:hypothetical protein [Chlamydiales bacterium]